MAVPKHLRFFTLFVDGENEVGKVTSVTLPKLTRKTDSYRGGGMMGAVSIDLGLEDSALDASFVMGGAVRELFLKYGGTIDGTLLRFAGEYYTDAESDLYEVEMRGRVTEIDMGERVRITRSSQGTPQAEHLPEPKPRLPSSEGDWSHVFQDVTWGESDG